MKKLFIVALIPLMLCGCKKEQITNTKECLDTTYTITADCNEKTLNGAFEVCLESEKLLTQNYPDSEISMLNAHDTMELSRETLDVLSLALYYCQATGGKYDITLEPISSLYNFEQQAAPTEEQIKKNLYKVGYERIEIKGKLVDLHNTEIELSSIKTGYIADKAVRYLKQNGAKNVVINFNGNVLAFGRAHSFEIKKPGSYDTMFTIKFKNKSAVTNSIYRHYFKENGVTYHHILNSSTGMPVDNDLAGVTVLGENAAECDVLSSVCMLLGEETAKSFINQTPKYEAVFIKKDNTASVSKGLKIKGKKIVYK